MMLSQQAKRGILLLVLLGSVGCSGSSTLSGTTGPNTIGMSSGQFDVSTITITQGEPLTFLDHADTGSLHILVPGKDGAQLPEQGAPDFGGSAGHKVEQGSRWTTAPWNTPGTFHVTCTVHPAMNLTVSVLAKTNTAAP